MPSFLRINAITRAERNYVTSRIAELIAFHDGWVVGAHLYSNLSLCLNFEMAADRLERFLSSLQEMDIVISEDTLASFTALRDDSTLAGSEQVQGTVQITFVHNEPDMKREVPPIPG